MRSLFWKILASLMLATALVASFTFGVSRLSLEERWLFHFHPALKDFASQWIDRHEAQDHAANRQLLQDYRRRFQLFVQVYDERGTLLTNGLPPRVEQLFKQLHKEREGKAPRPVKLTQTVLAASGEEYLFIYRLPRPALHQWLGDTWLGRSLLALCVLGALVLVSLPLSLYLTRPLKRLQRAAQELSESRFEPADLAQISQRGDELGALARDFSAMGKHLQSSLSNQRQLLRDVSHELRSPLARLRVLLALQDKHADDPQQQLLNQRITRECDRLDLLIGEILELARPDAPLGAKQRVAISQLWRSLAERYQDSRVAVHFHPSHAQLSGWPELLERALDNLLRNALRFAPEGSAIDVSCQQDGAQLLLSVRDYGPGCPAELLDKLGQPFTRAANQGNDGYGLGLAICRRIAERHAGQLLLANHPEGGFIATLQLPT